MYFVTKGRKVYLWLQNSWNYNCGCSLPGVDSMTVRKGADLSNWHMMRFDQLATGGNYWRRHSHGTAQQDWHFLTVNEVSDQQYTQCEMMPQPPATCPTDETGFILKGLAGEFTANRDLEGHYLQQTQFINGHPVYKRFKSQGEYT